MKTLASLSLAAALVAGCAKSPAPKADDPAKPAPPTKPPPPPPPPIDKTPLVVDLQKFEAVGNLKDQGHHGYDDGEGRMFYYSNGVASAVVKVPADGEYELTVTASCQQAQNTFAKFKVEVDGAPAGNEVALTQEEAREYKVALPLAKGDRKIGIAFTNDMYKENEYDLNFFVNGVKLQRVK
jgi:hypothetical protein